MEHEIAGAAFRAAPSGAAAVGRRKKERGPRARGSRKALEKGMGLLFFICGIIAVVVVSLLTEKKWYAEHTAQQGVFEDFFVRGRVSAWIRENISPAKAKK